MTTETTTGALLILTPVWFNVWFFALARRFDYPDILRRPTAEILDRFRAGGSSLILTWWAFMLSGVAFLVTAVLVGLLLAPGATELAVLGIVVGVLAALVQVLGLLRWVYLVPSLSRAHADPEASPARRDAVEVVFDAFHHYLGVGVGEHLGYLLTGAWTLLVGAAVIAGDLVPVWLGVVAIVIGLLLVACSAEFLGPNEERGWPAVGAAVPIVYVGWSIWMIAVGVDLVI